MRLKKRGSKDVAEPRTRGSSKDSSNPTNGKKAIADSTSKGYSSYKSAKLTRTVTAGGCGDVESDPKYKAVKMAKEPTASRQSRGIATHSDLEKAFAGVYATNVDEYNAIWEAQTSENSDLVDLDKAFAGDYAANVDEYSAIWEAQTSDNRIYVGLDKVFAGDYATDVDQYNAIWQAQTSSSSDYVNLDKAFAGDYAADVNEYNAIWEAQANNYGDDVDLEAAFS